MDEIEFRKRVEKYSNLIRSSKHDVFGANAKLFVRIDDDKYTKRDVAQEKDFKDIVIPKKKISDSAIFSELFDSLQRDDNHYITSLNSLFIPDSDGVYIPKYVPVLAKEVRYPDDGVFGEVVGSRLSSLMGLDTVFNISPTFDNMTPDKSSDKLARKSILSVDFLSRGWEYCTFNELIGRNENETTMFRNMINLMDVLLPLTAKAKLSLDLSDEMINNIKRSFIDQLLFRVLLCRDFDYCARNSGIVYNCDTGEVGLMPNFDMELSFEDFPSNPNKEKVQKDKTRDIIDFCGEKYPDRLHLFMTKVKELQSNGKLDDCLRNSLKANPDFIEKKVGVVHRQLDMVHDLYDEFMSDKGIDILPL